MHAIRNFAARFLASGSVMTPLNIVKLFVRENGTFHLAFLPAITEHVVDGMHTVRRKCLRQGIIVPSLFDFHRLGRLFRYSG